MSHTVVNPAGLHDPVPFGYGHTATVPGGTELVVVAGQYGSGPDGAVVSPDFTEQVQQAMRASRLFFAYQPVVTSLDHRVSFYEALLRMRDGHYDLVLMD